MPHALPVTFELHQWQKRHMRDPTHFSGWTSKCGGLGNGNAEHPSESTQLSLVGHEPTGFDLADSCSTSRPLKSWRFGAIRQAQ